MKRQAWWMVVIAAACGGGEHAPQVVVDTMPAPPAPLAELIQLAGRYPADAGFWETEPLRTRMTRLLGGDYDAFLENVRTSGPVGLENGVVFVTGTCPSGETVWGAGLLVADPAADRLMLKMYSQQWDSVRTYQDGEISPLPKEVRTVLAAWTERMEQGKQPKPAKPPAKKEPG